MTLGPIPTPDAVQAQLRRVLNSEAFIGSDKQKNFLRFVVNETLADRTSQIKGYTIAVSVYGRPEGFDPQVDPIVRVEAGRLRRALDNYYLTAGRQDPIRIDIPKGKYIPTFYPIKKQQRGRRSTDIEPTEKARPMRPAIAVLPLLNLTGDEAQNYFVDGLTEEMTTELSRYQDFRVIASQSSMYFKNTDAAPRTIGTDLGVRFLLTGSVRKDRNTIKVTVRLIDTLSGVQIWGENYKRDLTPSGLIEIQEDIGQQVVGVVADHYGLISRRLSMESRKKAPSDLKAYDAILRFYHYETELTPQAFQEALDALVHAVKTDPDYGLAWSMLGHLHADNYALGFVEIDAALEEALIFAQKGLSLAPQNQFAADALTLVYFHRGDKTLFLKHVAQTIALNPNSPYIIGVAGWHMMLYGEWEHGLTLLKKGMRLNPHYPSWFHLATYMNAYRSGEYEHAFAEAVQFNFPDLYLDPMMRAAALGRMGKTKEAKTALAELLAQVPDFGVSGRELIGRYVKVDDLVNTLLKGLCMAGFNCGTYPG